MIVFLSFQKCSKKLVKTLLNSVPWKTVTLNHWVSRLHYLLDHQESGWHRLLWRILQLRWTSYFHSHFQNQRFQWIDLSRIRGLGCQPYLPLRFDGHLLPRGLRMQVLSLALSPERSWKLPVPILQASVWALWMFVQGTSLHRHHPCLAEEHFRKGSDFRYADMRAAPEGQGSAGCFPKVIQLNVRLFPQWKLEM
jgi:hypothetical protein